MADVIKAPRRTQADRTAMAQGALVEAAVRLLSERGYAHATTAAIAKEAGVTTGALHHHFPTKESLFMAVLDRLSDEALALFRQLRDEGDPGETPADVLLTTLWSLYGSKRYWAVWEINMGFRPDEAMREALVRHRTLTRQRMVDTIANNDALRPDTRRSLLALLPFVLSSMRGIFLDTFFAGHGTHDLDGQLNVLRQVLARALIEGSEAGERPRTRRRTA